MSKVKKINFCSKRVEEFAIFCIQEIYCRFGHYNLSISDSILIIYTCDFESSVKALKKYLNSRFGGKSGSLPIQEQKELNLKLTIYHVLGRREKEKTQLIKRFIKQNEDYLAKKRSFERQFILSRQIDKSITEWNNNYQIFMKQIIRLYDLRKRQLKRNINRNKKIIEKDDEFKTALDYLNKIFYKHIKKASYLTETKRIIC